MSADSSSDLKFEIGHVLFIDIVGYSKLLIEEQKERLHQLTAVVMATAQVSASTDEQLVRLPTGDGMALVFRHSAEEPARCALEVAEALRKHPEIPVRMGIHSGPVSEVRDVSGRTNIAGAGINTAQRVMDCGDAGHILVSQHVADDLIQYRQWAPRLHDLGDCEVKHGVKLHLVNLYAEPLGNAAVPQKLQQAKPKPPRMAKLWKIAVAALLVILMIAGGLYYGSHRSNPLTEKDTVVLADFTNTTGDPVFDGTLRQGLASQLEQTPFLTLISDSTIAHTLTLMSQAKDVRLTPELARQVGQRTGSAATIEGTISSLGSQYVVGLQALNCRSGDLGSAKR